MKRLETSVVTAGATVFAKVDHGAGAESVGSPVGASQLLIFGNPQLGTPAIADDPLAGLVLPLKVLVYADDEGRTWIAYEEVEGMFDGLSIDDDAEYVENIETVLGGFVEAASSRIASGAGRQEPRRDRSCHRRARARRSRHRRRLFPSAPGDRRSTTRRLMR